MRIQGADVQATSLSGWDAVTFASSKNHADVVVLLARASGSADRQTQGGITATQLLVDWHGNARAAERARTATVNSARADQQLWHWQMQQQQEAAAERSAGVYTPRSDGEAEIEQQDEQEAGPSSDLFAATPDAAALSPRDLEGSVREALATAGEQKRHDEEARISALLHRSKAPLMFDGGGLDEPAADVSGTAPPAFDAGNSEPAAALLPAATIEPPQVGKTDQTVRDQKFDKGQQDRRSRIEVRLT